MSNPSQVTDLIKVSSRLVRLLEREIEILRAMKPTEIEALQEEKAALTAAYESQTRSLAQHPELLAGVQPALRTELNAAVTKFQSTLADNERALRAARDTSERVLQAIAGEIDRKRRENSGYSAGGYGGAAERGAAAQPVSVAVDQRL